MVNQPCPDCGVLMVKQGAQAWQCPGCGHKWTDGQIKLLYAIFAADNDPTEDMPNETECVMCGKEGATLRNDNKCYCSQCWQVWNS